METGSEFAKVIAGTSGTVDIIWSESGVRPGKFSFEEEGKGINTKILLNMKENSLYQRGIPGITDSAEGIVRWLAGLLAILKPTHVRSFGHSAGASSAIGFGSALKVDTIVAVGPEITLGVQRYRSYEWSYDKNFHPKYRDLFNHVKDLGNRLTVVYGAYDTSDYRHVHSVMRTGRTDSLFVPDMHSGAGLVHWANLANAPGPLPAAELLKVKPYDWKFDTQASWRGAASFEAIGRDNRFASDILEELMTIDPNPGLCYRLAVQKIVLDQFEEGAALWARAVAGCKSVTLGRLALEYRAILRGDTFMKVKAFLEGLQKAA